jgi:hypothetical protein
MVGQIECKVVLVLEVVLFLRCSLRVRYLYPWGIIAPFEKDTAVAHLMEADI